MVNYTGFYKSSDKKESPLPDYLTYLLTNRNKHYTNYTKYFDNHKTSKDCK